MGSGSTAKSSTKYSGEDAYSLGPSQLNLNTQYVSPNPMNFGVGDDRFRRSTLPVAAPEIIQHDGEDFIASLLPSLKGIRIAKLKWIVDGMD